MSDRNGSHAITAPRHGKPQRTPVSAIDWPAFMCQLGDDCRRIREAVGLSQEQLARLAGVSQGSVSRLEVARGLSTPLLVALKVHLALKLVLEVKDPGGRVPERMLVRRATLEQRPFVLEEQGEFQAFRVLADPVLEQLIRTFRSLPAREQQRFLDLVAAVAAAFS